MKGRATLAKFALVTVGTAVAHFVLTMLSLGAVFVEGFGAVRPGLARVAPILAAMFVCLGFPATLIIGRWVPSLVELPNRVFFSLMWGTSVLWGTVIGLLWRRWYMRKRSAAEEDWEDSAAP
jgi:hypothetical protein